MTLNFSAAENFSGETDITFIDGFLGTTTGYTTVDGKVSVISDIPQKKAIIIAGRTSSNDYLWDDTWLCVTEAYLALVWQGYTRDSIYFLSPENNFDGDADGSLNDVDGEATKENLSYAITDWAKDAGEVLIYMTDHGGQGTFYLNESEILRAQGTPDDPGLNEWLNQLQETMPISPFSGRNTPMRTSCISARTAALMWTMTPQKRISPMP